VVYSGAASDTESVLDGLLLISSSTTSHALVITSPENGKCLCRQDIGYSVSGKAINSNSRIFFCALAKVITASILTLLVTRSLQVSSLNRVEIASKNKESLPNSTVIVGGDGGEIAICRVLPFSPDRAGIRVLVELSTRSRWSEVAIAALSYERALGVVLAGCTPKSNPILPAVTAFVIVLKVLVFM